MSVYELTELPGRGSRQLHAAAHLQVVQIDGPTVASLFETERDSLPGARDAIEDLHHLTGVGGSSVDRRREQGAGEGAIRHLSALSHQGEFGGVFAVEGHVEPARGCGGHVVPILHD